MTNHTTTTWLGNMKFESTNPSGHSLFIDTGEDNGGNNEGYRPKALMLSGLAGCSGLDIAALIKKMKLKVGNFKIETTGSLTNEHPKYYNKVVMSFYFYGDQLDESKLQKAVDLSIEKYCGVLEMFRQFSEVSIETFFNKEQ